MEKTQEKNLSHLHVQVAEVASKLGPGWGSKIEHKSETESLGDRMKRYENENSTILDRTLPFAIRLDGHSFSKFTRSMQQPWDFRFMKAMVLTTYDLVEKFCATTGYTQSDEITLTFFPKPIEGSTEYPVLPFNGKIQKLVSLSAGYASARFNFHLAKLFTDNTYHLGDFERDFEISKGDPKSSDFERGLSKEAHSRCLEKVLASEAHFDARCFQLPSSEEVFNCILWRARDAYKNVVSKVAQYFFGHRFCFKKKTQEKLGLILGKEPDYFENLHPYIARGVLIKKEMWCKSTGGCSVYRTRMSCTAAPKDFTVKDWLGFIEAKSLIE